MHNLVTVVGGGVGAAGSVTVRNAVFVNNSVVVAGGGQAQGGGVFGLSGVDVVESLFTSNVVAATGSDQSGTLREFSLSSFAFLSCLRLRFLSRVCF